MTSDERLLSILGTLEECRTELLAGGHKDSARLVAMAVLDVKMQLHRIADSELRALCDEAVGSACERDGRSVAGLAPRPPLRVVK